MSMCTRVREYVVSIQLLFDNDVMASRLLWRRCQNFALGLDLETLTLASALPLSIWHRAGLGLIVLALITVCFIWTSPDRNPESVGSEVR